MPEQNLVLVRGAVPGANGPGRDPQDVKTTKAQQRKAAEEEVMPTVQGLDAGKQRPSS